MTHEMPVSGPSARGWSQQDLAVCPQAWAFSRLLQLRPTPSVALTRGGLVHEGIMHYWLRRAKQPHVDPIAAIQIRAEEEEENEMRGGGHPWRAEVPIAQRAVEQLIPIFEIKYPADKYDIWGIEHQSELWCADGEVVAPPADAEQRRLLARTPGVAAAREFYALGAPWLSTFRADIMLAPKGSLNPFIVDWKTGWRLDPAKESGFSRSGQFLQYALWGWAAYGERWSGTYVGFVNLTQAGGSPDKQNAGVRPKTSRPVPMFTQLQIHSEPQLIRRFPRAVCDRAEYLAALLRRRSDLYEWPRILSEQGPCTNRYGQCGYWSVCSQ